METGFCGGGGGEDSYPHGPLHVSPKHSFPITSGPGSALEGAGRKGISGHAPWTEVRRRKGEASRGPRARVPPAMSADQQPLEFHAKRHWRPKEVTGDPEEEDEEESDEAKNGFSLEEVLRLGGTKVNGRARGCCALPPGVWDPQPGLRPVPSASHALSRSWVE